MAKRTAKKSPDPGAPTESLQIPEDTTRPSAPWEEIAASVPKLPQDGDVTAHKAPAAKVKPSLPSGIYDFDPDQVQREQANQLPPHIAISRPTMSRINALGTDLLGTCAMANKLGTLQPVKVYITFSDDRRWCFLMPVDSEATKGLKVVYRRKQASINLWKPFQRSVEKGYTEVYSLDMTEEPITILDVKGYALYFDLATVDKQPIQEREEPAPSAKASGKTKASRSTAKSDATTSGQTTTEETADTPAEAAAEIRRLNEAIDKRDEQLEELDSQIDELEKRLNAYREKFGPLE